MEQEKVTTKKHRIVQTAALVLMIFALFAVGIVVGKYVAKSRSSKDTRNTTTGETTATPTETTTPTQATTATPTASAIPTPTSVTATGQINEPNFGYNITLPKGWTTKTNYNEISCDDDYVKAAIKQPCKGSVKVPNVTLYKNGSPDTQVHMFIQLGGMGGTCGDESSCGTAVASKVKVLGTEYDLGVNYFKDKNLYANPLTNAEIKTTGKSSIWSKYLVSVNALGQNDFQSILTIFNTLQ